jgi:hypothetical protein
MKSELKAAIADYAACLKADLEATAVEETARITKRRTHYQLITARETLRALEREASEAIVTG